MSIHSALKRRRLALGLSHRQLADMVSDSQKLPEGSRLAWQTVQQWEKEEGGTFPKRTRLAHVAAVLGTTVAELLAGRYDETSDPAKHNQAPENGTKLTVFHELLASDPQRFKRLAEDAQMYLDAKRTLEALPSERPAKKVKITSSNRGPKKRAGAHR